MNVVFCLFFFYTVFAESTSDFDELLKQDPSLFPGHMQPLGSKQPRTEIEVLYDYPTPKDFFQNYIKDGRPFLLKRGAVNQPAFKLWNDEYLKSSPAANIEQVQCEPNLKEIREARPFETSMKDFVERYHNEKIYMVNKVPKFLQKDVLMPPPLRCNNTRKLMLDHVTWMSTGGTKSVLHNDDLDNINCLFRGSKELLFINPTKYGKKVPIDRPGGGYSSLDVDKVNFTKYPALREVEYIHCAMEEGDCLFIPYRWYHQVNSIGNKDMQNIAVNIWFNHDSLHVPEDCEVPQDKISIDHWTFIGMDEYYSAETNSDANDPFPLISLMKFLLKKTKHSRLNFRTLIELLHKVPGIFSENDISYLELPRKFIVKSKEMFIKLNVVEDKYVDEKDFQQLTDGHMSESVERWLENHFDEMSALVNEMFSVEDEPIEILENDAANEKDLVEELNNIQTEENPNKTEL